MTSFKTRPKPDCIMQVLYFVEFEESEYLIEFMLVYTTKSTSSGRMFANYCINGMRQLLMNDLKSALTSEIHLVCNNNLIRAGDIEIFDIRPAANSFDVSCPNL